MATWQDGPEYAPLVRPEQFEAPDVAPLDHAESRSLVAVEQPPLERPDLLAPQRPVAALDTLVANPGPARRDPSEAFTVVSSLVTDKSSAWSAAHTTVITTPVDTNWAPPNSAPGSRPIRLSGQPANDLSALPPPSGAPWSRPSASSFSPIQPPAPVSFAGFMMNLTPAVVVTLLVGGLVVVLSPLLFAAAFILATRVRLARTGVLRTFTAGAVLIGLVGFGAILGGPTLGEWWSGLGATSLIASWLVLLVSAYLVLAAMQNRQTPTPPGQRRQTW